MDDSVTESKEAKAQTLAKMRDKKDVSPVPIDETAPIKPKRIRELPRRTRRSLPQRTHIH